MVLTIKLRQMTDVNMGLNEEIMTEKQDHQRCQSKVHQLEEISIVQKTKIVDLEDKQRLQYNQIKKKEEELYQLNRVLMNMENQQYLHTEKTKQLEHSIEEARESNDKKMRDLEHTIAANNEQVVGLTIELESTKDELSRCQHLIHSKTSENKDLS